MTGEVFTDNSMLEIFRAEVEAHVESLTAGLLALERDPSDTSRIDEMMRGAHSIKGAARIVGVEPAVLVAHVMEDGFIAAQQGKLTLRPEHVDVLLRGVDMLSRIANSSRQPATNWLQFQAEAKPLVAEITAVLSGQAPAPPTAPTISATRETAATAAASELTAPTELVIPLPAMFDAVAADTARRSFLAGLDSGADSIQFDLSATTDLDAIALAFLAAVPAAVAHSGQRVGLAGPNAQLSDVFRVTGIDRLYAAGGGAAHG